MNSLTHNSSTPKLAISKPRKIVVPLAVGLAWGNDSDQFSYQEKVDGRFETRVVTSRKPLHPADERGETILAGEYMGGEFYAFDLLRLHGEDCRNWPLSSRLQFMEIIFDCDPVDCTGGIIRRVRSATDGGEFLQRVLAAGGEGIVRKRLDAPWGTPMDACKRLETFTCIVTGMNAGQSVAISRIINGRDDFRASDPAGIEEDHFYQSLETKPCGNVKLGGGKCDRVRIGSILKIEGFGLTREGKIREPRPCKDSPTSWLIQY